MPVSSRRTRRVASLLAAVGAAVVSACFGVGAPTSRCFVVRVVDEQTGRGVPLVELRLPTEVKYWTDSAGLAILEEPSLRGRAPERTGARPGHGVRGDLSREDLLDLGRHHRADVLELQRVGCDERSARRPRGGRELRLGAARLRLERQVRDSRFVRTHLRAPAACLPIRSRPNGSPAGDSVWRAQTQPPSCFTQTDASAASSVTGVATLTAADVARAM
jgi:hypothetical protein